jgi:tRNA threonylcarbamoyladenosine biosynthesis protein TsaE
MNGSVPQPGATGEWLSHSDEETFALGARLGAQFTGGEIVLLDGPLGAGKTIFAKGVADGLGVNADEVNSPSFTLVNLHQGRLRLYHLDLYRLDEGPVAAHRVGLEELLADEQAVIVIEWAERISGYRWPAAVWRVHIAGDGADARRIVTERT